MTAFKNLKAQYSLQKKEKMIPWSYWATSIIFTMNFYLYYRLKEPTLIISIPFPFRNLDPYLSENNKNTSTEITPSVDVVNIKSTAIQTKGSIYYFSNLALGQQNILRSNFAAFLLITKMLIC